MRAMGHDPSKKDIEGMFREVDANGNGTIDFTEFVRLMKKKKSVRGHYPTLVLHCTSVWQ